MEVSKITKFFFKISDEVVKNEDGTASFNVVLKPRFGKIGLFLWFLLEKL